MVLVHGNVSRSCRAIAVESTGLVLVCELVRKAGDAGQREDIQTHGYVYMIKDR